MINKDYIIARKILDYLPACTAGSGRYAVAASVRMHGALFPRPAKLVDALCRPRNVTRADWSIELGRTWRATSDSGASRTQPKSVRSIVEVGSR